MGKTYVKNGTPVGSEPLCKSCRNGQYVTGYRESEVLVRCCLSTPAISLPFVVYDCSDFADKRKPDWEQMEKLAIHIAPARISKKVSGFSLLDSKAAKPEDEPAVDDEDEPADAVANSILNRDC